MNTQAHVLINLCLLRQHSARAVVWGSLLPDLPMVLFWLWYTLQGTAQQHIWDVLYFTAAWQTVFNVFNSFPLILVVLVVCLWRRYMNGVGFAAAMLLHCVADFFLHREDAHAHFFPLTNWMFMSPVSYWERDHGGMLFGIVELLAVLFCAWYLYSRMQHWWSKTLLVVAAVSLVGGHLFWILLF